MRFCLMMKMQRFCFRTFLAIRFDTLFLPECVKRVSMSKWYKILWDIKIFQLRWISTLMLPKKWRNKNLKALITTWRKQYKLDDMKQAGRICCLLVSYYLPYSKNKTLRHLRQNLRQMEQPEHKKWLILYGNSQFMALDRCRIYGRIIIASGTVDCWESAMINVPFFAAYATYAYIYAIYAKTYAKRCSIYKHL